MGVFICMAGLGTVLFCVFLGFLVWSIRDGQYENLDIEAERALWDDLRGDAPRGNKQ